MFSLSQHILESTRNANNKGWYTSSMPVESLPIFIRSLETETLSKIDQLAIKLGLK